MKKFLTGILLSLLLTVTSENSCMAIAFIRYCDILYVTDFDSSLECEKGCVFLDNCLHITYDKNTKKCFLNWKSIAFPSQKDKKFIKNNESFKVFNNLQREGYCRKLYAEKMKIDGQDCYVVSFYNVVPKKIHTIYCNGQVKVINKLPLKTNPNCSKDICIGKTLTEKEKNMQKNSTPKNDKELVKPVKEETTQSTPQIHYKYIKPESHGDLIRQMELESCGSSCGVE